MTEKERMLSGRLYNPYKTGDNSWEKTREALDSFNSLKFSQSNEGMKYLRDIFAQLEDDAVIVPPFYCDRGAQIRIGKHFFANTGFLILDEGPVTIGDNVFIGPRVCIYTACHPIDAKVRNMELEYAKPVAIGDDVWIGGNAVINPGVTVSGNVIIGSGSIVTKDIPSGVVAAGNPCRVIREITHDDEQYWNDQLAEYRSDPDIG
ncbi:MAG: sugar O-acetyltransferase [Oscillospiraceae bacterium]|nr:sugar O-acetyltransferase [Oscillospiraceae bacterium]